MARVHPVASIDTTLERLRRMWFSKWFKPVQKIQPTPETPYPTQEAKTASPAPLKQICEEMDVDRVCSDVVLRRYLITVHWTDVQSLFEAILNNKRSSPSLVAVNLYTYFKTAGSPASICLTRLSDMLQSVDSIPHSVSKDVDSIVAMFRQLLETHPELKHNKD